MIGLAGVGYLLRPQGRHMAMHAGSVGGRDLLFGTRQRASAVRMTIQTTPIEELVLMIAFRLAVGIVARDASHPAVTGLKTTAGLHLHGL